MLSLVFQLWGTKIAFFDFLSCLLERSKRKHVLIRIIQGPYCVGSITGSVRSAVVLSSAQIRFILASPPIIWATFDMLIHLPSANHIAKISREFAFSRETQCRFHICDWLGWQFCATSSYEKSFFYAEVKNLSASNAWWARMGFAWWGECNERSDMTMWGLWCRFSSNVESIFMRRRKKPKKAASVS